MISVTETKEFVPCGRLALSKHPGKLLFKEYNNQDLDNAEEWIVSGDCDTVSELYVKGNTVVWSKNNHVIKSFTVKGKVKQALWCRFHTYPDRPFILSSTQNNGILSATATATTTATGGNSLFFPETPGKKMITSVEDESSDYKLGEPIPTVVIHESGTLKIYTEKGEDFSTALPLPIKRCWNCKYGLLLERECRGRQQLPVLFALLHPLDDLTRIVMKDRHKCLRQILSDDQSIIFTAVDPSICVIFNSETGRHSVWKIRKAFASEKKSDLVYNNIPSLSNDGTPVSGTTPSGSLSRSHSHTSSLAASTSGTPINSHNNSVITPGTGCRNQQQPSPFATLAAICRSPTSSVFPSNVAASRLLLTPNNSSVHSIRMGDDWMQPMEPLPPEISICLEHLWVEPTQEERSAASKIFLSKDVIGRNYLNYLISEIDQLSVVRFGESNEGRLIFSIVHQIPALDAAFIEDLNMTMALDPGSTSLTLYSGTTKVSRVTFNACNISHIAQEISTLNLDSKPGTPNAKKLMTSSRPPSASLDHSLKFNESMLTFSPIEEIPGTTKPMRIHALRDAVNNKVTLRYFNGSHLQLTLPSMATTPLVRRCLSAVKTTLSREMALHLQSQWYAIRNAPGPACVSPSREWELFSRCLMGLIGYQTDRLSNDSSRLTSPTTSSSKKMRKEESGSDGDWQRLLSSTHHQEVGKQISALLGLEEVVPIISANVDEDDRLIASSRNEEEEKFIDSSSSLFPFCPAILWSLHLLYENSKLDKSHWDGLRLLAGLLVRLAADMRMTQYVDHYWRDFPEICSVPTLAAASTGQMCSEYVSKLTPHPQMTETPPCIYKHLRKILLKDSSVTPFPYMSKVAKRTKDVILCYIVFSIPCDQHMVKLDNFIEVVNIPGNRDESKLQPLNLKTKIWHTRMLELLLQLNLDRETLDSIPPGISLPLRSAIFASRKDPPSWPIKAYELIGRPDLASRSKKPKPEVIESSQGPQPPNPSSSSGNGEDGTESAECPVTKLRWPNDRRISEVRRLLQSAKPVTVSVQQRPEMTDHEFVEEQEKCLHSLCIRTMALPVGRGALTLQTSTPLITEPLQIPKLCLTGRAPPRGATVEMEHIDVVPNEDRWPTFHNGVAAGLRMRSDGKIDSAWITFNKPHHSVNNNNNTNNNNNNNNNNNTNNNNNNNSNSNNNNNLVEHAGFLMALGLNGHLSKLGKLESFDYLMKGSEMISIGILLGISAAKRGSMDILATKKVSTQLEALLPATATELPLSHTTQVAGLVGLGLLYQRTGHRHMSEVCLGELGRPPGPELENCTDRESYSLAAGLALGMITLGQGNQLSKGPLTDLDLPDALYHHMVGGPRSSIHQRHIYRSPSYQIQEGDSINIDVTSPGATLALGMMFFRSGNAAIAEWMTVPKTQFLLEFVRPDFLMLRTLAKGLIMWDSIVPTIQWVESHVPDSIGPHCLVRPADNPPPGVDYETINQAYCNIISGAALVMGLRFAGSSNAQAFEVLHSLTRRLIAVSKRSVAELAGKATIEQTICVHVLAMSIVMAGSGELEIIRIIRYLRSRTGSTNSTVTYGSHMALHMALGLLFLGGGRYTLSTTPEAVAAMICAFFPKFPTHSNDNRYHLQALRHLYVLAAEPRLLVPKDVETDELAFCHVSMQYCDTPWYAGHSLRLKAPVMLPELRYLTSVTIADSRYHPVNFDVTRDPSSLREILEKFDGCVSVKRRAGCVSYKEDPLGFRSLTAQCLTRDPSFQWTVCSRLLDNFSNVPGVSNFHDIFLKYDEREDHENNSGGGDRIRHLLGTLLYECACHEKLDFLPVWISTFTAMESLIKTGTCQYGAGQFSMLLAFFQAVSSSSSSSLLSPEISSSVKQSLNRIMDEWKSVIREPLRMYSVGTLQTESIELDQIRKLTSFLIVHNLPSVVQSTPSTTDLQPKINPLEWMATIRGSDAHNLYYSLLTL